MRLLFAVAPLLTFIGALPVPASTIAYNDPSGQASQGWGGNLALTFDVTSPITVTALGVYNALGDGHITGVIYVAIYDTFTNIPLAVASFNGNYTPGGLGFDVFQPINLVLGPGSYAVDAVGFSGNDRNGNLNTGSSSGPILNGGGSLTFTGAAWDGNTVLDLPASCSTCKTAPIQWQQFDAGTFQFTEGSGVPEPATFGLLGFGFVGFSALLRRRRVR